ncbi:hypothetical protein D0Z00_004177 [Geotrichum galactomycetum]|uniref:Uncharacterized protein n=1 Tax=Geotrichum galactomycetum TaxID=27317 RepID=A0ACB6UZ59_9ASCO|nr:hypothetical protein D0Z00_004177 [Geotrichum candidum]
MVLVVTTDGKTATHTSVTVQLYTVTPTFDTRTATGLLPTEALTIPTSATVEKDVNNSSSTSTGTIVGSVVGSVAGVAIICLLMVLFLRFRKKKKQAYLDKDAALQDDEIMRQYGGVGTTTTAMAAGGGRGGGSGYNNAFNSSLPSISDHHAAARAATEFGEIQAGGGARGSGGFISKFIPIGLFSRSGPGKPPSNVGSAATSSRSNPAAAGATVASAAGAGAVDNPRSFYRKPRRASVVGTGGGTATTTMTGSAGQSVNNYGSVPVLPAGDNVFHDDNRLPSSDENSPQSSSYHHSQQQQGDYSGSSNSNSMNSQSWSYPAEPPAGSQSQQFHRPFGRHVVNADNNEWSQEQQERQGPMAGANTHASPLSPSSFYEEEESPRGLQGKSFFTEEL